MPKGYKQLVAEAEAEVRGVTPDVAAGMLGDTETLFIDLRERGELEREGIIPGARNVPRGMLEFWLDPESPYHKPFFAEPVNFVFFCAMGWRSALAAKTAQDMGLQNVCHIEGGFTAWKASGAPVAEKQAPAPHRRKS